MLNYFVWGFMAATVLMLIAIAAHIIRDLRRHDEEALRRD